MLRLESDYPEVTGSYRPDQIAHMSTWAVVPDDQRQAAAMTNITVVPKNASTETFVNPLDPCIPSVGNTTETGWTYPDDSDWGRVIPAGRGY